MPEIRAATVGDAAGIAYVHTQVWREAYADLLPAEFLARRVITADRWLDWLTQPGPRSSVRVALDDAGRVIGFAATGPGFGPTAAAEDESLGQLYAIYVLASYWGSGIGYGLHRAALDDLRAAGFSEAQLFVLPGNARAIAFYERQGWTDRGIETEDDLDGVRVTERLYWRGL
jgi:ribosomal protein S18 acetylase RimI-like enzyme